jgi:oligoendopeptidase F
MRITPSREQVDEEATWNLTDIYPSCEEWEADIPRLETQIADVVGFTERAATDVAALHAFLQARDRLMERMVKVYAYAQLRVAADALAGQNQAMVAKAEELMARVNTALSPFEVEMGKLPHGTLARWLQVTPELEPYRSQLEELEARRPHLLSVQGERLLASLGEVLTAPSRIHQQVTATARISPVRDEHGIQRPVSLGSYLFGLSSSPDRELRRRAYENLMDGYEPHAIALAGTLAAGIRRDVVLARLRGYTSTAEMFLQPQGVPSSVYHTVIDVMHDEVRPHVQRLLHLRRRVLDLDRVRMYDLNAPLDPELDSQITYEAGRAVLTRALSPLGEEYAQILHTAFEHRWIDRAHNVGRAAVPFCAPVYGAHPYVLTVWDDRMASAFILGHELGHACHGHLAAQAQIISNAAGAENASRFLLFVEVPSRLHEFFLALHLMDTARDHRVRRRAILRLLDSLLFSLRTSLLQARMERRLHAMGEAGEPITLSTITDLQGEALEGFFGDTLEIDDRARLYWVPWPQLYEGTYTFTYPAGIACAYGIAAAIRDGRAGAVENYLAALRAGSSRPPLELAHMAGVDLGSHEPYERFGAFLGRLVDDLDAAWA